MPLFLKKISYSSVTSISICMTNICCLHNSQYQVVNILKCQQLAGTAAPYYTWILLIETLPASLPAHRGPEHVAAPAAAMGTASRLSTVTAAVLCLSALRLADARKKGSGGGATAVAVGGAVISLTLPLHRY